MTRNWYYLCAEGRLCSFQDLPALYAPGYQRAWRGFRELVQSLRNFEARLKGQGVGADALEKEAPNAHAAGPELLFFGDSTLDVKLDEADTRGLSELLARLLSGSGAASAQSSPGSEPGSALAWPFGPVLDISGPAHSFLLYERLFRLLPEGNGRALLLPWNLRAFSEEWLPRPSYQFPQAQAALKVALGECGYHEGFAEYFDYTETDRLLAETLHYKNNTPFFHAKTPYPAVQYYCYPAQRIQSRANGIKAALAELRRKNYRVFSYLSPINYRGLQGICNVAELTALHENIAALSSLLQAESAAFADFSRLVPSAHFEKVEHIYYAGRARLAAALAVWLRGAMEEGEAARPGPEGSAAKGAANAPAPGKFGQSQCGPFWEKFMAPALRPILPEEMNRSAEQVKLVVKDE